MAKNAKKHLFIAGVLRALLLGWALNRVLMA